MTDREYTTIPAMLQSGLSQSEIAMLTGVNRETVRKFKDDTDAHMVTVDEYDTGDVYSLWTRRG